MSKDIRHPRHTKNLNGKKHKMVHKGKRNSIQKKPAKAHYAKAWLGLVVKAFFGDSNADKDDTYKSQHYTGGCIKARRIVKRIDAETG